MADDIGAFLGYVFLFLGILIIFILCVNRLRKMYCPTCCPGTSSPEPPTNRTEEDSIIAERIQREIDEEEAQQRRMERRKKRKQCYGKSLEKYTMVSQCQKNHLTSMYILYYLFFPNVQLVVIFV